MDGFYGGDELSLVNFSELEPDEVLSEKYTKGGQKWLLVSFKSKHNAAHFGRLVFYRFGVYVMYEYIYIYIYKY